MRTDTRSVMLSKFKVKSVGGGSFQTHFYHNREQSCALVQTQPSLIEVYEAEIRRLREENRNLKIQHNTMANQLNEVLAEIQLHKASYGKREQKNLCQSKQSLQNKENISEKWAYRGGSGSSAPIHPPASGGGLECAVLVNSVKFKFQVFQCK